MLAVGLMVAMGAVLLAWYYTHTALRPARARDGVRTAAARSAAGDAALPPLPRAALPARPSMPAVESAATRADPAAGPVSGMAELPSTNPLVVPAASLTAPVPAASPTAEGPHRSGRSGMARRLAGPVYAAEASGGPGAAAEPAAAVLPGGPESQPSGSLPGGGSTLAALLRSEPAPTARASVLAARRLLLPQGAFIDCTLETAIDSTLPGMTTCVTATDTFGVDGKVVLLERGTKLVGETRGQVQQGSARVFVIWTQARTPTGVLVPLESPGTDALGRAGLEGEVNRHFWDRFGAAILISTIDGAVQAAVEAGARGGGTTIINPSGVEGVGTETLKGTLNIPPTIIKRNGDRIQVLVARDIDFSSVYELRPLGDAR